MTDSEFRVQCSYSNRQSQTDSQWSWPGRAKPGMAVTPLLAIVWSWIVWAIHDSLVSLSKVQSQSKEDVGREAARGHAPPWNRTVSLSDCRPFLWSSPLSPSLGPSWRFSQMQRQQQLHGRVQFSDAQAVEMETCLWRGRTGRNIYLHSMTHRIHV